MGFNIGRFLGAVAAPILGSAFGPVGTAVGAAIGAGFAPDPAVQQAATVGRTTQPGPISISLGSPNPQFGGSFINPTSIGPTVASSLAPILRQIPGIATGIGLGQLFGGNGNGRSPISAILAKARAATGGAVTRNKIIDAAKACGLETTAATFGLDLREVCLVIVKGRSRRRRGVSAADIRRTKRTIGFASKIRKDLKALAR